MTFSSYSFAAFLACLGALWTLFGGANPRKALLLAANLVFAWCLGPSIAFGLVLLSLAAYAMAKLIDRRRSSSLLFAGCVLLLLAVLFEARSVFAQLSSAPDVGGLAAGISFSFVIFPLIALLADVKLGKRPPPLLLDCALFTGFFPVLTAGPMLQPKDFFPRLNNLTAPDPARARGFVERVSLGLFKKYVVANHLGMVFRHLALAAGPGQPLACLLVFHVYTLEVFFDFAGYTDIALGVGRLVGFELPENFDAPFFATSPIDWWRRWHMSLTSFFREYVYYPLFFTTKNIFLCAAITFVANGLWHGLALNYLFLGVYWAFFICLYLAIRPFWDDTLPRWVRIFLTVHIAVGSFIFFLPDGIALAARTFGQLGASAAVPEPAALVTALAAAAVLPILTYLMRRNSAFFHFGAVIAVWALVLALGAFRSAGTFIYSQF